MKYKDNNLIMIEEGDLVGFTPSSEFEFVINGERLYRVLTSEISIKLLTSIIAYFPFVL